jgi:hypothetical protein
MNESKILLCVFALFAVNGAVLVLFFRSLKRVVHTCRSHLEYDELPYEPVYPEELPRATRAYFDRLTPEIVTLGFEPIGDCRVRPCPLVFERCFLSADRCTFAYVVDWRVSLFQHIRTFEFASVLPDGTYVATGAIKTPPVEASPGIRERLCMLGIPGAAAPEAYDRHLEHVAQYTARGDNRPLEFSPEEFKDVGNYGHHLVVWKRRCARGLEGEPPTLAKLQADLPAETAV